MPTTQSLGLVAQSCNLATGRQMEWLEESNLVTLIVNWLHTDVDFKSGLCYSAGNMVPT